MARSVSASPCPRLVLLSLVTGLDRDTCQPRFVRLSSHSHPGWVGRPRSPPPRLGPPGRAAPSLCLGAWQGSGPLPRVPVCSHWAAGCHQIPVPLGWRLWASKAPPISPVVWSGPACLACRLVVPSLSLSSSFSAAFPGPWGSHVSHGGLTEGNHLPSVQVHTGTAATRTGTSEVRWVHSLPGGRRRLPCVPGAPPVGVALGLGGREGLGRQPWVFTVNTQPG